MKARMTLVAVPLALSCALLPASAWAESTAEAQEGTTLVTVIGAQEECEQPAQEDATPLADTGDTLATAALTSVCLLSAGALTIAAVRKAIGRVRP